MLLLLHPRSSAGGTVNDPDLAQFRRINHTRDAAGDYLYPSYHVSINFQDETTWEDVTPYVRAWGFRRGAEHELSRISPGTLSLVLDNRDGNFDPENTAGDFYPNVKPMKMVRLRLAYDDEIYPAFVGLIQNYPVAWPHFGYDSDVKLDVVDAFSVMSLSKITTTQASLVLQPTDDETSSLTYTTPGSGFDGNRLGVAYYERPFTPNYELHLDFSPTESVVVFDNSRTGKFRLFRAYPPGILAVGLRHDPATGEVITTAKDVAQAIAAHTEISQYFTAEHPGTDGNGVLAPTEPAMLSGGTYVEELSGTRVNNVLDDMDWPAGLRNIDAGNTTLAGASFSAEAEQKALEHLLAVDGTEGGRLFVDGSGNVRFQERHWRMHNRTSHVTLGEQPAELPYRDMTLATEIDEIRNDVTVSSAHSVEDYHVESQSSIDDFYRREYTTSLLTFSEREAETYGNYLLYRYAEPSSRANEVEVLAAVDPTLWPSVLGREISDLVTRKRRPLYGGTNSAEARIEAIRMDCRPGELRVTWQLSPAIDDFWILGDSVEGVLGSTTVPGW